MGVRRNDLLSFRHVNSLESWIKNNRFEIVDGLRKRWTISSARGFSFRSSGLKNIRGLVSIFPLVLSFSYAKKNRGGRERDVSRFVRFPPFPSISAGGRDTSHIIEYLSSSFFFSFVSSVASSRRGEEVARRGFRFQNDWGEIGVSRYRLATLDVISSRA